MNITTIEPKIRNSLEEGRTRAGWPIPIPSDSPTKDKSATLAVWLLSCPGDHAFWSDYVMLLIHLRPIPDVPPAHLRFHGATHEINIFALDPEHQYDAAQGLKTIEGHLLHSVNASEQVPNLTDAQAIELLDACAHEAVSGRISPDSDYRHAWTRFIAYRANLIRDRS